jgi:hypothetical protein
VTENAIFNKVSKDTAITNYVAESSAESCILSRVCGNYIRRVLD